MLTLTTGYQATFILTLKKGGATFAIDSGATVKAALISSDHTKTLIGAVTVASDTSGSDWAASKIVVVFPPDKTSGLSVGKAKVEISVADPTPEPFFVDAEIVKGHITA